MWVSQQAKTVCSLRHGNNVKAWLIIGSLAFQVLAVLLLSLSVGFELSGKA
jgi:hypothetical protein